jgi:DNA-binding winged helix-turn-helix (wHTH) protein
LSRPDSIDFDGVPDAVRYRFADCDFDAGSLELRVAGRPVSLEPRPARLLAALLRQTGEVVTKEELMETVWDGRITVDHVVANAVSKLRSALGETGAARLQNVPRVGYRLQGPVTRLAQPVPELTLAAGQPVPGREGYSLVRALGPGPEQDVWLALHGKLGHQRVFKFARDGARLAGLKREFTLYRVLQQGLGPRPDIARVLDANFALAPFYIECEYGGDNLLDWSARGNPLAALPRESRLALFLQIARAVAAAHAVGVLHKDLKPANVLVRPADDGWQVCLTDFGSGRLLDPERLAQLQLTQDGVPPAAMMAATTGSGTPMYLAPELMAGQTPTVQSDVYALGLLLWQLLTGDLQRPLATGWQRELDDPLLVQDIAEATEGLPEHRLPSVADLVDRLQRLPERRAEQDRALQREALAAQAQAELARARARRPWRITAVASLVLGLGASLALAWEARSAQARAEAQAQRALQLQARADAVNRFLAEDFLAGIDLASAGPEGTVSMRAVLERASERAGQRFAQQPEAEVLVRGQLASLFHLMSLYQRGADEYRRALALADPKALATDPALLQLRFALVSNLAVHNGLPEARERLAALELEQGETVFERGDALAQGAWLARTLVRHSSEDFNAALPAAERLLALADRGVNPARVDDWFAARLILGDTLTRLGRLDDAQRMLDEALAPVPAGVPGRAAPAPVSRARAQVLRARVWTALGRPEQAEPELIQARNLLIERIGEDEHYVNVADAELALIYQKRGDFERARQSFGQVHARYRKFFGDEHPHTRVMALNLAIAAGNSGRPAEALRGLDSGRDWFVRYLGGENGAVVQAVDFERARALTSLGRGAEALALLQRLEPEKLAAAAPARDWTWRLQAERGRALLAGARGGEGQRLLREALPAMAQAGTPAWLLRQYQDAAARAR